MQQVNPVPSHRICLGYLVDAITSSNKNYVYWINLLIAILSRSPPRRCLLEEVHYRKGLLGTFGPDRRGLRTELRRKVDGHQPVRFEAFGVSSRTVNSDVLAGRMKH